VTAAKQAGQILIEMAGRVNVTEKGVNDLVTEADHASQATIRRILSRHFPNDDFIEEEGPGLRREGSSRRWIIDPLDGTTNYVHGFPFYCVSIALETGGMPVVGVVYDPTRNDCFVATAGGGATRNGAVLRTSATNRMVSSLMCIGIPTELTLKRSAISVFERLTLQCRSVHRLGSAALTLAYVAAGRIDGYWTQFTMPWDCAAGVVLVREAGGQVTNQDGSPYDLYTPDILATNGLVHTEFVGEIGSVGGNRVQ
jgi:myo-inositol-1(or 4)-monophosphatase